MYHRYYQIIKNLPRILLSMIVCRLSPTCETSRHGLRFIGKTGQTGPTVGPEGKLEPAM